MPRVWLSRFPAAYDSVGGRLESVIATGGPSLLGLTGYPVEPISRGPRGRPMGLPLYLSWYRYYRIRNRKERCDRGDRMKDTFAPTSSLPTYPFPSPQLSPRPKATRP